jgi:hypothetical protein
MSQCQRRFDCHGATEFSPVNCYGLYGLYGLIWIDMDCNTLKYVQPTMLIDVGTEVSSQSPSL